MIIIDDIIISDDVVEQQFVCDLSSCKGGCCVDGDAGAPLDKTEKGIIDELYEQVKPYMTASGIEAVEEQGKYLYNHEFGWVTPTINSKVCAYGFHDELGVVKCAFEKAYYEGKIEWKKPISCHLYPIRIKKSKLNEKVNYDPRESLCDAACTLGEKLKVPVYVFLREALIRKYGESFYETLDAIAQDYFETQKTDPDHV